MSKVKGVNQVKIGFKRAFEDIKDKKAAKAVFAALTVLDQEASLIVPIGLTSNLANNRTLNIDESGNAVTGTIRYLSNYAAAVHAMPNIDGWNVTSVNWKRASAENQWLMTAAADNKKAIDATMVRFMSI